MLVNDCYICAMCYAVLHCTSETTTKVHVECSNPCFFSLVYKYFFVGMLVLASLMTVMNFLGTVNHRRIETLSGFLLRWSRRLNHVYGLT